MDTNNTPSAYQVRQLRQEAAQAGDDAMVAICTLALGGEPRMALPGETQESCLTACRLMIAA